ncbi:MAG: hypothetical protein HYV96_21160 [Opitutae bacterium]|nr:hypothetical protein [Opitutae bacterium]
MAIARFALALSSGVFAAFVAGCVNLAAVRDFAGEAKMLSAYSAIPADLVGTNVRRQALYGREEPDDALGPYKEHRKRFEESQAVLVKYMGALAAVADDGVVDYKKNITDAAAAATKAGVLEKTDADLFSAALNLVAKLATDAARQKLLAETVKRCDGAVQKLTAALAETIERDYMPSLDAESMASGTLLRDADAAKNPGLSRLAHFTLREHDAQIEAKKKSAAAFATALKKIAEGHAKLATHANDFTAKELVAQLKGYQSELKELQAQFK